MRQYKFLAAGAAVAAALALAPVAVAAESGGPPVPVLSWTDLGCAPGFQCATARVPLDYRNPRGEQISLKLLKRPATDPARRIGTLFFNPGGPGNASTQKLPLVYDYLPAQARARFDVVGFDPRGVGQSTAAQCFDTAAEYGQFMSQLPGPYPVNAEQQRVWISTLTEFGKRCEQRQPELLRHVSTATTARDLDLLRRAVGDAKLSYYGESYGTYLGATYANLFPDKVRALVLDANDDPVAWATGRGSEAKRFGLAVRMDNDLGYGRALRGFLDLCGRAGLDHCAFAAGSDSATRAKFDTLLDRLRERPVQVGQRRFNDTAVVADVAAVLSHTVAIPGLREGWAAKAVLLQQLWTASESGAVAMAAAPMADGAYAGVEQSAAVVCSESPHPSDPQVLAAQGEFAAARGGEIGRYTAWKSSACGFWPVTDPDRYLGPWNRWTSAPILLIGHTGDPNTPYSANLAMARELARGRLLTVDGYGHTALENPSACASGYADAYLVSGTLPAAGTRCLPDRQPFG